MTFREHLLAANKLNYVMGQRPDVACILCAVVERNDAVTSLEVYRDDFFVVSVNLYPYNSGHVLIFPCRHVIWPGELSEAEALHLHHLQQQTITLLQKLYSPRGFNLGYNLGDGGGGSIPHLHLHIVPRFHNELGFMTTVAGTHIAVESASQMANKIAAAFAEQKPSTGETL